MHELSITQSMLDLALKHAEKAGAKRITYINLVVGEISGVVDQSVQFYFDLLSKDTLAEGGKLVISKQPARFRCKACGNEFRMQDRSWVCPACQAMGGEVISGREFYMESIEVE
jgi:hydrogenase nickel incorporation protein HypA/HybF